MSIFYRIVTAFFVLAFCQLPVFVDEYAKHLEGHVSESKRSLDVLDSAAKNAHKSRLEYIEKFQQNADPDVAAHGTILKDVAARYDFLQAALRSFRETNVFLRPIVCVRYMDREIMLETVRSFTPGFLLSREMIAWGFIGWCVSSLCLRRKGTL
jgi:hypothetical protein